MRSFKKEKKKPKLDEVSSSQKYNVSYNLRDIPYENRIQLSAACRIKKKDRVCKCALDTEKTSFKNRVTSAFLNLRRYPLLFSVSTRVEIEFSRHLAIHSCLFDTNN